MSKIRTKCTFFCQCLLSAGALPYGRQYSKSIYLNRVVVRCGKTFKESSETSDSAHALSTHATPCKNAKAIV
ncbi:hypothetical protein F4604DRAFT_1775916 [Suillus subluteus]|nr:hypothetical protein F4604DRAFT_1775916 [Suillus subluteus]